MIDPGIEELFDARRHARLEADWGGYQPSNPIASDLHDCERYQTVRLVAWKVRAKPDARGLEVIEDGNVLERAMIAQLVAEGWELVEQQAPFEVRQPLEPGGAKRKILSGKMDGKIVLPGDPRRLVPIEFKSTSEWNLEALETEQDLKERSVWTRKWWRQLQVYMLGAGYEDALLVLGFRGRRRVIPVRLDYDEAERILVSATRAVSLFDRAQASEIDEAKVDVWLNEQDGAPGYHSDIRVCRQCPFFQRACFPPDPSIGSTQLRPDLEDVVAKLVEAKPQKALYDKLYKVLKAETEGCEATVAGRFVVDGEWTERKNKAQPAKPASTSKYWSVEVRGAANKEDDE